MRRYCFSEVENDWVEDCPWGELRENCYWIPKTSFGTRGETEAGSWWEGHVLIAADTGGSIPIGVAVGKGKRKKFTYTHTYTLCTHTHTHIHWVHLKMFTLQTTPTGTTNLLSDCWSQKLWCQLYSLYLSGISKSLNAILTCVKVPPLYFPTLHVTIQL